MYSCTCRLFQLAGGTLRIPKFHCLEAVLNWYSRCSYEERSQPVKPWGFLALLILSKTGEKMKDFLIFSLSVFSFLPITALCQNPETEPKTGYGYLIVTPGAVIGDGGASGTLTLGGGGEGLIKGGLGISADLGYMFPLQGGFGSGIGLFSPGVVYQFRTARRTVPFVTGGYSLAFRNGVYNMIHFGGGFNHWFSNRWGIRVEGRDHIDPREPEYNLLQFRVGLLLR